MDDFLSEAVKQVPSLVVLAFVVVVFLKHLARRDISKESADQRRDDRSLACMNKCSSAIDRNTEMLGQVAKVVERANGVRS